MGVGRTFHDVTTGVTSIILDDHQTGSTQPFRKEIAEKMPHMEPKSDRQEGDLRTPLWKALQSRSDQLLRVV